ncbi:Spo0E family sporulation regulatory protein-aspartic acid phosphatase [Ectobacillus panaciterrae]|uniref:Spo0E family sporulation regulatory protein-aspartic acid phosphatase n=1 Tax=Ectobacillus panaciterrae TaxID=363872 RepID=UPI000427922D|nr:Spo0E family sporulation regulatory protein-aspartic acid phosphatase [Ectobacillus panaciterrae]
MDTKMELTVEIERMKKLLTNTAEEHNFDLQHPSVLHLSHQLDFLIIKSMKDEYNNSSYTFDFSAIFEFSLFPSKLALRFLELVTDLQQPLRITSQYPEKKNTAFRYLH